MYFSSEDRLIIRKADNKVILSNPYTNERYEIAHNISGDFCVAKECDNLLIMYAKENENLYKAELIKDKFKISCILERKSGDGVIKPHGIISYKDKLWYLYGVVTNNQEIIALHQEESPELPETIISGTNILFDYIVFENKLYFCFNEVSRIVVKIYDLELKKWLSPQIVKYEFEYLKGLKAIEREGKLSIVASGKVKQSDLIKTVCYTYENAIFISEYDATGEEINLLFSFDNCMVFKIAENYIVFNYDGTIKTYDEKEYKLYKVMCMDKLIAVFLNNNLKPKRELEEFVIKNKTYIKLKDKIKSAKRELYYNEKEMLKILKSYGNIF